MGKSGKQHRPPRRSRYLAAGEDNDDEDDPLHQLPSSAYDPPPSLEQEGGGSRDDGSGVDSDCATGPATLPSKFHLYQISVQSPKGDISYMHKFFLMYVGGRAPLHLQEDFCGTALLSCEWLQADTRKTSICIDLDLEALSWCLENNVKKIGSDGYSRISLYHGNVLDPQKARLIKTQNEDLTGSINLLNCDDYSESFRWTAGSTSVDHVLPTCSDIEDNKLPDRDIVCAFNYSCCCLQRRSELLLYFKHALGALSKKGGIFVMDIYGGTSSECKLRLQRRFSNFTYIWEQAEFDIINRRTRISLHFHLGKKHIMRHAFSYDWRLWSLPEIKDCMEEAGFQSVHFWVCKMPESCENDNCQVYNIDRDVKYEAVSKFQQEDSWNAYIVGVANV